MARPVIADGYNPEEAPFLVRHPGEQVNKEHLIFSNYSEFVLEGEIR
ncbi:hypothetical protein [Paenibacillus phytohabitans]